jgi:hypothetical protein
MAWLGAAVFLMSPGSEAADDRLRDALAVCAAERNPDLRLQCFDRLTAPVTEPEQFGDAQAERQVYRADQADGSDAVVADFGSEMLRRAPESEGDASPPRITATIEAVERRPYGEHVFHLSNGQVWTELEPGRFRYRAGRAVTIERTPFGAYMLSTDAGRATRVRRLE